MFTIGLAVLLKRLTN